VVLDLPGFTVKAVETMSDGRRYMVAEDSETHFVVSQPGMHAEIGQAEEAT
jgi:hypothetical protein